MTSMRLEDIDLVSPDTFAAGPPHDLFARLRREAGVTRPQVAIGRNEAGR